MCRERNGFKARGHLRDALPLPHPATA